VSAYRTDVHVGGGEAAYVAQEVLLGMMSDVVGLNDGRHRHGHRDGRRGTIE
jgi:hypothetical protein